MAASMSCADNQARTALQAECCFPTAAIVNGRINAPLHGPPAERVAALVATHEAGETSDANGPLAALGAVAIDIGAHEWAALHRHGKVKGEAAALHTA